MSGSYLTKSPCTTPNGGDSEGTGEEGRLIATEDASRENKLNSQGQASKKPPKETPPGWEPEACSIGEHETTQPE